MFSSKEYPEVVKTFLEIVPITNKSTQEEELVLWLVDKLTEIGVKSIYQDSPGNVIAKIDSTTPGNPNSIMFIVHLDSVMPCENIAYKVEPFKDDFIIRPKGKTILSADDKAGVAAVIEAVKRIKKEKIERPNIELVFTVQEEIGLKGAKTIDFSQFKSKIAYSVDGEAPVGTIITQGPSQKQFVIDFFGKSAHAGMDPEKGISAILIAAEFLNTGTFGRIDHATTSNVGIIQGGRADNIIPEQVTIKGEVRSLYETKLDGLLNSYKLIADKTIERYPGSQYDFMEKFIYHSFFVETHHKVVQLAVEACNKSGINPVITSIGSGSDANIFNNNDVSTVILGAGFQNSHSLEECITFSQLEQLYRLLINIIIEAY